MRLICKGCKKTFRLKQEIDKERLAKLRCKQCGSPLQAQTLKSADIKNQSTSDSSTDTVHASKKVADSPVEEPEIRLFRSATAFLIWAKSKEKPSFLKNLEKNGLKLFNKIGNHQELVHIPNKKRHFEEVLRSLQKNVIQDHGVCDDNKILGYLKENLQGLTQEQFQHFFDIIFLLIFEDKLLSTQELETLHIFARHMGIDRKSLDRLIEKYKKSHAKTKNVIHQKQIKTRKGAILKWASVATFVFLISIAGFGYYKITIAKSQFQDFSLSQYIEQNPKLVFKKVYFSKYVIYGRPPGTNSHLEKLYVYHVRGNADIQFDMKSLTIDSEATDPIRRKLVLNCAKEYPIEVDVDIPVDQFSKIEELEAEPISSKEAKQLAKMVAVPAGLAGAYVGTKVGGGIGGNLFRVPIVGRLAGGIIGGGLGATGASVGAYLMTKNFLNGLTLENNELGEQDRLLGEVKPLIALELLNGSTDAFAVNRDEKIREYYRNQLNKRLEKMFHDSGWHQIEIRYGV